MKDLSRRVSKPTTIDVKALKRLARYLVGKTRYAIKFERQGKVGKIDSQVDTDCAGCLRTRKSAS